MMKAGYFLLAWALSLGSWNFAGTAIVGPASPIPPTFFGLHIHHAVMGVPFTPWPTSSFKTWRLWAANVTWPDLEPKKGAWNFEILDKYVALAEQHQIEVVLPLALTPSWVSERPMEDSAKWFPLGSAAEPSDIREWSNYVQVIATRYKGRIHYYEIWNEPNLPEWFSGSVDDMISLAQEAYITLKRVDPTVSVISPAPALDSSGRAWLATYLSKGGGKFCDIIGYHFYVTPQPPEAMVPLIKKVESVIASYGLSQKPLWNTESGWEKTKVFGSDQEAAAYLARAYILNWAAGVSRFYWYSWDDHQWVSLYLTEDDNKTPTRAGKTYAELQKWLVGAKLNYCQTDTQNDWICELRRSAHYSAWVVWNPQKRLSFTIPGYWGVKQTTTLEGTRTRVTSKSVIVGQAPVLFENIQSDR